MEGVASPELRYFLDESAPFDTTKVNTLEILVGRLYNALSPVERDVAHQVLEEFRLKPDNWRNVALILSESKDANTKFFALQLLESCIQTQWNALPDQERAGIKQYITELVIKLASSEITDPNEKPFLFKVNNSLIEIAKREWPDRWPTFLKEVCQSSRSTQRLCENNMRLLSILSEEVFDFGVERLGSKKAHKLMQSMTEDFCEVFELCMFVLKSHEENPEAVQSSLVTLTLKCLSHFMKWIPLGYIFETDLLVYLTGSLWESMTFRTSCTSCLYEVAHLTLSEDTDLKYSNQMQFICNKLVAMVQGLPPASLEYDDVTKVPMQMRSTWEGFYRQFSLFVTTFMKNHLNYIEAVPESIDPVIVMIVKMTLIPDEETFKICIDFWRFLVESLHDSILETRESNSFAIAGIKESHRLQLYRNSLDMIREGLISRTVKPQEVYVQFDPETGELSRDTQVDTDELALFNVLRETLVYLTHLDPLRMESIIVNRICQECSVGSELNAWNPVNLNRVSWATGLISGTMDIDLEKRLIVLVIGQLLSLCEIKRGKANKTIVATCIMYVVSQYPRFLKFHWKFLKTVIFKVFDFMNETFPGVQDMATETFLKVTRSCAEMIVGDHPEDQEKFIIVMIDQIQKYVNILNERQLLLLYEGIAYCIEAGTKSRNDYLKMLLSYSNGEWQRVCSGEKIDMQNQEHIRAITKVVRIHLRVAVACEYYCVAVFPTVFPNIMQKYEEIISYVNQVVGANEQRMRHSDIRAAILYCREVLHYIETCLEKVKVDNQNMENSNQISAMLSMAFVKILSAYQMAPTPVREYQVLNAIGSFAKHSPAQWSLQKQEFIVYIFYPTLEMLKHDYNSFPEHRAAFYDMLSIIVDCAFEELLQLPSDCLKAIIESLVWCIKHPQSNLAEKGLKTSLTFLKFLATKHRNVLEDFCQLFYYPLLETVLVVMSDTLHRSGFALQASILQCLINLVESDILGQSITKDVVSGNLKKLLATAFPTLNQNQIQAVVADMFTYSDPKYTAQFKTLMRDFLISIKELSGTEEQFYLQEKEEALERARQKQLEKRSRVPGLVPVFENTQLFEINEEEI